MAKQQKKKILWQAFQEENVAYKEQEEIGKQYQVDADKIVVKKVSTIGKLSSIAYDALLLAGKVFLWVVDVALVSFALTVLLNSQLREAVFEIMKTWQF